MEKEENLSVYQSNPLLTARRNYGILEHRLLRLALADLQTHLKKSISYGKEIRPFHMDTSEAIKAFGGATNKRIYEQLREACKKMFDSKIEMGDDKNLNLVHLFSEISFDTDNGINIYFSQRARKLLLEMERGNYTRTLLSLSFSLSSKYSLILLELMLQYQGRQKNGVIERDLSIEELRFSLDVPENAYAGRMNNFRRFVIDSAIAEINEKTDYHMEPEYGLARGRFNKITGFHFTLHLPKVKEKNSIHNPNLRESHFREI
ncbi:replication initiation protein [Candidatus Saccharibacteria bacterium]|nr:replication initiation protein [Candidatus Saccharibacteria bacterium]